MTELQAIDKLIEYYGQYEPEAVPPTYREVTGAPCPLCASTHGTGGSPCDGCPWVKHTGKTCVSQGYAFHTAAERIGRLEYWRPLAVTEA